MKKSDFVIAIVLGLAVVLAVKYFQPQEPEQQVLELPPRQPVVAAPPPAIRHPVPEHPPQIEPPVAEPAATGPEAQQEEPAAEVAETVPENPLPGLDHSDDRLKQDLYTLAARQTLESLFNLDQVIRRFVVTVDNLPRKHLLHSRYRSNRMVRGRLQVGKDSQGLYLREANFTRYDTFVDLLESMDSNRLVALYLHYYPLMQTAYEDLGYPAAYFNDRLIDIIDHLLETPDIEGRIALVQPHVLYKYADPELEALSAGQKVLIRIGPRNAARVKSKLRELRQALS